jgi:dihydropyrimidinase
VSRGLLIVGGTLVTAEGSRRGDVRVQAGRIVESGERLESAGEEVLDATDLLAFPGCVDPHVHMELPVAGTVSSDDFESGTAAGLAGGTTTIVDFVHPERGESFFDALAARKEEAAKSVADYGLHMAVTWWGDESAGWMADCVAAGVPSFKIYMAYKATVGLGEEDLESVMRTAAGLDSLLLVHAEIGDEIELLRDRFAGEGKTEPRYHALSRPTALEGKATAKAAAMAGAAGARLYVVHVTCRESIEAIAEARAAGWRVTGETCPQYLLLDDAVYDQPDFEGAAYVIAPPIRPVGHQEALWSALEAGTLEIVATDHCPFTMEQKRLGRDDFRLIPGGAAGIEHRPALLYTHGVAGGVLSVERFVDLLSTTPAKRFGLYPRKGSLDVGADADLVLWDPAATATISAATDHHHCDRSIYEGLEVRGTPATVIAGGQVRYRNGDLDVERGAGRFLERRLVTG